MDSNEIRQMWLDFFESKGHSVQESVSLIPNNDKTLLWINSGVAALKKYFDGSLIPENKRITNAQKCIRTNDIENVGITARHHTLFEMLGNFSIGDYFKEDAIAYAYELLTSEKWFAIPIEKLYMTIYPGDEVCKNAWLSHGVPEDHILECAGNFWEIGAGPCGPDSEIFFDRGPEFGDYTAQDIIDEVEQDRYIEIWNIVFSQYNSTPGLSREEYPELPNKNIDTGAGFERFCLIMQNALTNYETDLFLPIIKEVERISGVEYSGQAAFKIIADHVRSVSFAIADGALLSNEGRGYVLRRLLRRAVKNGKSLGINEPFMAPLVDLVVDKMGGFYPNLVTSKDIIKKVILNEEIKFNETLSSGLKIISSLELSEIDGPLAFTLYDTYGFPIELTVEYANEHNLTVDMDGFKKCLEEQKNRARMARSNDSSMNEQNVEFLNFVEKSEFIGYSTLTSNSKVIKVFKEGLVFDKTPFYAESGGQISDSGYMSYLGNDYQIVDVYKLPNKQFLHVLETELDIKAGDEVTLVVDEEKRNNTLRNHSATHVMFSVMRKLIGSNVSQSGSFVSDKLLRFDFTNYENISDETILEIEKTVKEIVKVDTAVKVSEMTIDEAKELGAIAEFGEKYESLVRCVIMGDVTTDLCGGTHVNNLKDINDFLIVSLESKGSGIFRVTALAGEQVKAVANFLTNYDNDILALLEKAKNIVSEAKTKNIDLNFNYEINHDYLYSYQDFINKRAELHHVQDLVKDLDKEYKKELAKLALSDLSSFEKDIKGDTLISVVYDYDKNTLKDVVDALLVKLGKGVVFVANVTEGKIIFVSKCNNNANCGILVKEAAMITGGKGGGKKEMAMAGGNDVSKLDEALNKVREILNDENSWT